eukprot:461099-Amorphochlora_amoeboformis.AAC.1
MASQSEKNEKGEVRGGSTLTCSLTGRKESAKPRARGSELSRCEDIPASMAGICRIGGAGQAGMGSRVGQGSMTRGLSLGSPVGLRPLLVDAQSKNMSHFYGPKGMYFGDFT